VTNGCAIDKKAIYQIRLRGILDSTWSEWFDNFSIIPLNDGETLLAGQVRDQAALYGILAKTHNLGLLLLSVNRMEENENDPESSETLHEKT